MKTIIINLFGGPGCGKSTGAAYIFSKLKMAGFNAELVQEYAKDRVWQEDWHVLKNQVYIAGKQHQRVLRVDGKVDIIVTDSPILLSALYLKGKSYEKPFRDVLKYLHEDVPSLNVILTRVKKYQQAGRYQDEDGAKQLDVETKTLLEDFNIEYKIAEGSEKGYNEILDWGKHLFCTLNYGNS